MARAQAVNAGVAKVDQEAVSAPALVEHQVWRVVVTGRAEVIVDDRAGTTERILWTFTAA